MAKVKTKYMAEVEVDGEVVCISYEKWEADSY